VIVQEGHASIARGAFFGGLALGGALIVAAFYAIPQLDLHPLASLVLELASMILGLMITTRIWRASAARGSPALDSTAVDQDRGETVTSQDRGSEQ
jgi:hypothetical protein